MKWFSLFDLLLAVSLFGIGISVGSWSRGYTWQKKMQAEAEMLASNKLLHFHFDPEDELAIPLVTYGKPKSINLSNPRHRELLGKELLEKLWKRNGIEYIGF